MCLLIYAFYALFIYIDKLGEESSEVVVILPFIPLIGNNGWFLRGDFNDRVQYYNDKLYLVYLPIGFYLLAMILNGYVLYIVSPFFLSLGVINVGLFLS